MMTLTLDTCIACDRLTHETEPCVVCTDQGHKNAGYCLDCRAQCITCGGFVCADHFWFHNAKQCDTCKAKADADAEFRAMLERASTLSPEEVLAQRYRQFIEDFQSGVGI